MGEIDPADPARTKFIAEFDHDGASWGGIEFYAEDFADAEARIASMRMSLRLCGEHIDTIPGPNQ
jgi:hypothetical protein